MHCVTREKGKEEGEKGKRRERRERGGRGGRELDQGMARQCCVVCSAVRRKEGRKACRSPSHALVGSFGFESNHVRSISMPSIFFPGLWIAGQSGMTPDQTSPQQDPLWELCQGNTASKEGGEGRKECVRACVRACVCVRVCACMQVGRTTRQRMKGRQQGGVGAEGGSITHLLSLPALLPCDVLAFVLELWICQRFIVLRILGRGHATRRKGKEWKERKEIE